MYLIYIRHQLFFVLILLFSSCWGTTSYASHSMGADLSYTCVSGNTYTFTLSFYRDCSGISAPSSPSLNISSASGCGSSQTVSMLQQSVAEASPLCPSQLANSTCNGGNLQGVEVYTYTATVTLSGACTDWVISFSDCCRNAAITNSNTGSTYVETTINNVAASCNNSPRFLTPPVPYICNNQPFSYNHGTIDSDGDSLVFSLINPKESATLDITHNAGFSATQPLSTTGAFNFDANTGQMDFTPNAIQIGVVAILVEEYRNGVLIGTTMRDMEIVVINCSNNTPVPNPVSNVQGGFLNGNAFETCPGNTLSFDIVCPDPDLNDVVTISNNIASNLPGAIVNTNHGNPAVINVSWLVTVVNNQSFTINFNDGACPVAGQQTLGFLIKPTSVSFPAQDTVKCPNETSKQLEALAGSGRYTWSPAGNVSNPNIANPIATITSTPATFSVTYTDPLGCTATNSLTITDRAMNLVFTPDSTQLQYCAGDPAVNLIAALNGDAPTPISRGYTVGNTTFAPIPIPSGTSVSLSDDAVSVALPIGFSFDFWGISYTNFYISSNGFITFNSGNDDGCCAGQNLPSTSSPNNLIAFAWEDLDPGNGGQPNNNLIRYQTIGTAPNRTLIVEFLNVEHISIGNHVTAQVHLLESSNCIEIHTTSQPHSSGTHTMGIENARGNSAVTVSGRNATSWTAANEGIVFCPIPDTFISNYSYSWTPIAGLANIGGAAIAAAPPTTTTYICTASDGTCTAQRSVQIGCTLLSTDCNQFTIVEKDQQIHLQWSLIHDNSTTGFVIERSTDGVLFEEIGWLDAYHAANKHQHYTFRDQQVVNGTSYYYQLKQVDLFNQISYICDLKHIQTTGEWLNNIQLHPNPTKGNAFLNVHTIHSNTAYLKISNTLGQTLINLGKQTLYEGNNTIEIPMQPLTTGLYYIELSNPNIGFRKLVKVIKQ